jgi:hypothetical protein
VYVPGIEFCPFSFHSFTLFNSERASAPEFLMTPFGGLVAFVSFLSHLGVIDRLVKSCPVNRTSPNATPIEDLVIGFILTCVIDGKRFAHIRHIQADEVIAKAFGVTRRIRDEDAIRCFFEQIDGEAGRVWISSVNQIIYGFLDDWFVLDWDSTATIRCGDQELVEVSYNPTRPGRGSHHPLVCTVAGNRSTHFKWQSYIKSRLTAKTLRFRVS